VGNFAFKKTRKRSLKKSKGGKKKKAQKSSRVYKSAYWNGPLGGDKSVKTPKKNESTKRRVPQGTPTEDVRSSAECLQKKKTFKGLRARERRGTQENGRRWNRKGGPPRERRGPLLKKKI